MDYWFYWSQICVSSLRRYLVILPGEWILLTLVIIFFSTFKRNCHVILINLSIKDPNPCHLAGQHIQASDLVSQALHEWFEWQAMCQPTNRPAALMRGEHEVEQLGLSGSALSAAVSHLRHEAMTPVETMTHTSLMVWRHKDWGVRLTAGLSDEDLIDPPGMPTEGWREGGGNAEEEAGVMDGVRMALS